MNIYFDTFENLLTISIRHISVELYSFVEIKETEDLKIATENVLMN